MPDFEKQVTIANRLASRFPRLANDPLASAVLTLAITGTACDSRTAAARLEQEHALVLRAVTMLCISPPLLEIIKRNSKTTRLFYRATQEAVAHSKAD